MKVSAISLVGALRTCLSAAILASLCPSCALLQDHRTTEEREAAEKQRAADDQRHAAERTADENRRATEERRHAAEDLRNKFIRYGTAELKLMDTRYKELRSASGRDLNLTLNPAARKIWGDSDTENTERILEIERELLRRWKAGDQEAYLPEFGTPNKRVPSQ